MMTRSVGCKLANSSQFNWRPLSVSNRTGTVCSENTDGMTERTDWLIVFLAKLPHDRELEYRSQIKMYSPSARWKKSADNTPWAGTYFPLEEWFTLLGALMALARCTCGRDFLDILVDTIPVDVYLGAQNGFRGALVRLIETARNSCRCARRITIRSPSMIRPSSIYNSSRYGQKSRSGPESWCRRSGHPSLITLRNRQRSSSASVFRRMLE